MTATPKQFATAYLAESQAAIAAFAADAELGALVLDMAARVGDALREGRKLLIAGNGGSAADAQHIAGEFISRFMYDRAPLPAIALTTDTSGLTAMANDYGYEIVFERQVRGLGQEGDVFLGISTSGDSRNIVLALEAARARGMITLGFCGSALGKMAPLCDFLFRAPSSSTPIIQQVHIVAAHLLCSLVERDMFPPPESAG